MAAPTVAEMLKYANLQMAAEALYRFNAKETPSQSPGSLTDFSIGHFNGVIDPTWLTDGNLHATRFATKTEADKFIAQWAVVDHISNTTTGFSGTLFKNKSTNELVISFRSTEFIDDVARDCVATNAMEIADCGWAFGQISDMEAWYAKLKADGKIPSGAKVDATGYSLGGHLATAFNLLRQEELAQGPQSVSVGQVVTFNGAGVGQVTGSLSAVMQDFKTLRQNPDSIAARFTDPRLAELYTTLATSARADFASLLSLIALSPVALQARAGEEAATAEILGQYWSTELADWKADKELTADQRATRVTYTDQYLKDRAAFFDGVSSARIANTGEGKALRVERFGSDDLHPRSTGKNGPKRNSASPQQAILAANDAHERQAA